MPLPTINSATVSSNVNQYGKFEVVLSSTFNGTSPHMYYDPTTPTRGTGSMTPFEDTRNGVNCYGMFSLPPITNAAIVLSVNNLYFQNTGMPKGTPQTAFAVPGWTSTGQCYMDYTRSVPGAQIYPNSSISNTLTGLTIGNKYTFSATGHNLFGGGNTAMLVDNVIVSTASFPQNTETAESFSFTATAASHVVTFTVTGNTYAALFYFTGFSVSSTVKAYGFWDGTDKSFKVRFSPFIQGQWAYSIYLSDSGGTSNPVSGNITVSPPLVTSSVYNGFLKTANLSPLRKTDRATGRDKRYITDGNDKVYLTMGADRWGFTDYDQFKDQVISGLSKTTKSSILNRYWITSGGQNITGMTGSSQGTGTNLFALSQAFYGEARNGNRFSGRFTSNEPSLYLQPQTTSNNRGIGKTFIISLWANFDHAPSATAKQFYSFYGNNVASNVVTGTGWNQYTMAYPSIDGNTPIYNNQISVRGLTGSDYVIYQDIVIYDNADPNQVDLLGGAGHYNGYVVPNYILSQGLDVMLDQFMSDGAYLQLNCLDALAGDIGSINPDGTSLLTPGQQLVNETSTANSGGGTIYIGPPTPSESLTYQNGVNDTLVRRITRNMIRYCVARWGWSPNVAMLEASNEINPTDGFNTSQQSYFGDEVHSYTSYGDNTGNTFSRITTGSVFNRLIPGVYESDARTDSQLNYNAAAPSNLDIAQWHNGGATDGIIADQPFLFVNSQYTSWNKFGTVTPGEPGPHGLGSYKFTSSDTAGIYIALPYMRPGIGNDIWTVKAFMKVSADYAVSSPYPMYLFSDNNATQITLNYPALNTQWQEVTLSKFTLTSKTTDARFIFGRSANGNSSNNTITTGSLEVSGIRLIDPNGYDHLRVDCDEETGIAEGLFYTFYGQSNTYCTSGESPLLKPVIIGEQNFVQQLAINATTIGPNDTITSADPTGLSPSQWRSMSLHMSWGLLSAGFTIPIWWDQHYMLLKANNGYSYMNAVQTFANLFGLTTNFLGNSYYSDLSNGWWRELRVFSPPLASLGVKPVYCYGQSDCNFGNPNQGNAYVIVLPKSGTSVLEGMVTFTLPAGDWQIDKHSLVTAQKVFTNTVQSNGVDPIQYNYFNLNDGFALRLTKVA